MTCEEIKNTIELYSDTDISKGNRNTDIVQLRYAFYYLCIKYADDYVSYSKLGRILDKKHASVISGIKKFYQDFETDKMFQKSVNNLVGIIEHKKSKEKPNIINKVDKMSVLMMRRKLKNLNNKLILR